MVVIGDEGIWMKMRTLSIIVVTLIVALGGGLAVSIGRQPYAARVVTVGRTPLSLAVDTHADHVFVLNQGAGGASGTVSILDATDGSVRRTLPIGYFPRGIVVDKGRGRAFVIASAVGVIKASVSILDTHSGQIRRRIALDKSPSFVNIDRLANHIFVGIPYGNMNGHVQVLDAATGHSLQTVMLGFNPLTMAVDDRRGRALVIGSSPTYAGHLAVLDIHSERLLRINALGGFATPAIAIDTRQGYAFVATVAGSMRTCGTPRIACHRPGTVHLLDVRDGRMLKSVPVGDNPSNIVVDERTRRVFVVNKGTNEGDIGTVSVLDAVTGRLVGTTTVGYMPTGVAIDTSHERIYVTNGNSGTVSVLDGRNGRLLGALRVPAGPGAVVVDDDTGRVFVCSADTSNSITPIGSHPNGFFDHISFYHATMVNEWRVLRKGRTGTVSMFDAQKVP